MIELSEVKSAVTEDSKPEIHPLEYNPFDFVTIKTSEYRKLIRKIEKMKAENKALTEIAAIQEKAEDYRRWWQSEEREKNELRKSLDEAKKQIQELLGLQELEKTKLENLQYEKGVSDAEQA